MLRAVMEEKHRDASFDIAKGVGIILVVIGHAFKEYPNCIYSFHMPLFFIISGYFLSVREPVLYFAKKKARVLLVPYFVYGLIGIVVMFVSSLFINTPVTPVDVLTSRFIAMLYGLNWYYDVPFFNVHIQRVGTFWFLPALTVSLVVVRLAILNRYSFVIILMCCIVGCVTSAYIRLPLDVQPGLNACLFVYIGYLSRKYALIARRIFFSRRLFFGALIFWIAVTDFDWELDLIMASCYYENFTVDVVASLCMVYVVMRLSIFLNKTYKWSRGLAWLGENTLYIYCVHALSQVVIWRYSPEYHEPLLSGLSFTVYILLVPFVALYVREIVIRRRFRFVLW